MKIEIKMTMKEIDRGEKEDMREGKGKEKWSIRVFVYMRLIKLIIKI